MTAKEINDNWNVLYQLVSRAILRSAKVAVSSCGAIQKTAQEPDYVARLVMDFSPELYHILKVVFPQLKFSVTGVYIHQKPLADIGSSPNPEIGDILFVYRESNSRRSIRLNSILLQAKVTSNTTMSIPSSEMHQFTLYSQWPTFTYRRAGNLDGQMRDILPKTITDGAQYLLIDNHPLSGLSGIHGTSPMGCATASNPLHLNAELSVEILNFLKFKSGRTCDDEQSATVDDWSKMIWDLIRIAEGKMSKRKNMGVNSFPRISTLLLDGMSTVISDFSSVIGNASKNEVGDNDQQDLYGDDSGGVSVIILESQEEG